MRIRRIAAYLSSIVTQNQLLLATVTPSGRVSKTNFLLLSTPPGKSPHRSKYCRFPPGFLQILPILLGRIPHYGAGYVIRDFEPFDPPVVDLLHQLDEASPGRRQSRLGHIRHSGRGGRPGGRANIEQQMALSPRGPSRGPALSFRRRPPPWTPTTWLSLPAFRHPAAGPDRPWPRSAGGRARAPRGRVRPASQRRRDTLLDLP